MVFATEKTLKDFGDKVKDDEKEEIKQDYDEVPLEDKVALCSGDNFWQTKAYEKYGKSVVGVKEVTDEFIVKYSSLKVSPLSKTEYDVTDMISSENKLGILVGDGWYRGRFGYDQSVVYSYGGKREVIAELYIGYEDGTEEIIVTDDSWKGKDIQ